MVSPIVNACPSEHKDKAMSLLHSFYCWGGRSAPWRSPRGSSRGRAAFAGAGALGCGAGPAIVGTGAAAHGDDLQAGLLVGALFSVILLVGVVALHQLMHATRRDTAQH